MIVALCAVSFQVRRVPDDPSQLMGYCATSSAINLSWCSPVLRRAPNHQRIIFIPTTRIGIHGSMSPGLRARGNRWHWTGQRLVPRGPKSIIDESTWNSPCRARW
jgi:hypothetical protein